MIISIGRQSHYTTGMADGIVATLAKDAVIGAALASTIASWWMSSGGLGAPFASLATGAPVSAEDLRNSILAEMNDTANTWEHHMLRRLLDWLDSKTAQEG